MPTPWTIEIDLDTEHAARLMLDVLPGALADRPVLGAAADPVICLISPEAAKARRHALAEALLGIEATTVEEYRNKAHALAMNWEAPEATP